MTDNELVIEERLVNELSMIRKSLFFLVYYTANPAGLEGVGMDEFRSMIECI